MGAVQVLTTAELRRRLAADNRVFVCATDPGIVITNVVRSTPGWLQSLYRSLLAQLLMNPKQGNSLLIPTALGVSAGCLPEWQDWF